MGFQDPIVGGQSLVIPSIHSPNFLTGVSGWTINKDGSAEFNNGVFRGTVTAAAFLGTDFVINTQGQFFYGGTPAAKNLIVSIAPAGGTDPYGNQYLAGVTVYDESLATGDVGYIQMIGQQLTIGNVNLDGTWQQPADGAGVIGGSGANIIAATATIPGDATTADGALLSLFGGAVAQATGSATAPTLTLTDTGGTSALDMAMSGSLRKATLGGTPIVKQSPGVGAWATTVPYNASWAAGSTTSAAYKQLQFWIENDNLFFAGAFHATGAAGIALLTLPAATGTQPSYRPKDLYQQIIWKTQAGTDSLDVPARFQINSAGVVNVASSVAAAANVNYYVAGFCPLGNLP